MESRTPLGVLIMEPLTISVLSVKSSWIEHGILTLLLVEIEHWYYSIKGVYNTQVMLAFKPGLQGCSSHHRAPAPLRSCGSSSLISWSSEFPPICFCCMKMLGTVVWYVSSWSALCKARPSSNRVSADHLGVRRSKSITYRSHSIRAKHN